MGRAVPFAAGRRAPWLRSGLIGLALAGSLLTAAAVSAKLCGDDVDGADVPCACGDIVVSSVAIGADPVVHGAPCAHDGLVVRAPDESRRADRR